MTLFPVVIECSWPTGARRRPGLRGRHHSGERHPGAEAARGGGDLHPGGPAGRRSPAGWSRRSTNGRRRRDSGGRNRAASVREERGVDLFEYQGKQYFARYGIPVSAGGVADTVEEAVAAADEGRLSRRGQGPGPGGGTGQGRRRQAGRQRRRGAHPRRQHPRPRHQGPRRAPPLGRARLGHRQGVLRQLHARPGGQEVPRHGVRQGRRRDRDGRRRGPDAIARLHIDPGGRLHRDRRRDAGRGGRPRPEGPGRRGRRSC